MNRRSLLGRSLARLVQLVVVLGVVLFVPAGTLRFWEAWVLLSIFAGSSLAITLYLLRRDPKLLERRLAAGPAAEKRPSQKLIQGILGVAFLASFVVPALDHRFGWTRVPAYAVAAGDALVALAFLIVFLVFKENTFASATIEVDAEQRVIATGPYALVRHPMYAGALLLLAGVPLALGSLAGFAPFVPIVLVIVWRLLDEEAFLAQNLAGYDEYRRRTRYRLVPRVW